MVLVGVVADNESGVRRRPVETCDLLGIHGDFRAEGAEPFAELLMVDNLTIAAKGGGGEAQEP